MTYLRNPIGGAQKKLKILMVAQGRFHVFDLARALQHQGHSVSVLSNYPKSEAERFGLDLHSYKSFVLHRILCRILSSYRGTGKLENIIDRGVHEIFSRWAARHAEIDSWDVLYVMSGVAESLFRKKPAGINLLVRGSSHIVSQRNLLAIEEKNCGRPLEKPGNWIVDRELREYETADRVVVLSSFARDSFLNQGFSANRLMLLPSGIDIKQFRPDEHALLERISRAKNSSKIRVLTVGSFSYRKGAFDYAKVVKTLGDKFEFTFVGDISPEASKLARTLTDVVNFKHKAPHHQLPNVYAKADLFYFPTIEDGYGAVLAQALISGLPSLAGRNSSAPDLIEEDKNGWLIESGQGQKVIDILSVMDADRGALADVIRKTQEITTIRDWEEMAQELVGHCTGLLDMEVDA